MIACFNPDPRAYADPTGRADRVCRFIRNLTLWEGRYAGKKFPLFPFQEAILRRIYGPTDADGKRVVRTAAIWIPRGNAKTTLGAGIGLAHLLGPEAEAGGQIIAAAGDREQAGIAFNCALKFCQHDDVLLRRVRPVETKKTLYHPKTDSRFTAISHESYTKHGLNASLFLADEIHAWPAEEGRKLYGVIVDSMVKRDNPLTVIISTAGEGVGGLAWDLWDYSHKLATGEIENPAFASIIFEADPKAEWTDEDAWKQANPAIEAGFCSVAELRTKAEEIKHRPKEVSDFRRFHLNHWIEGAADPWMPIDIYDAAQPMTPIGQLRGLECFPGIDLSSVTDLTAVVSVFPDENTDGDNRAYDVLAMFFLPEEGLAAKADADKADYLRWRDQGYLTVTKGNCVDHREIVKYVVGLGRLYGVKEIPIDRWNSTAVSTMLQEEGFEVIEFGQGFASMAAPVRELKRAILAGQFRHGGNPILRMCFANVVAETDAHENEKFTKSKANGRIDGAVAAAMAIGRIIAAPAAQHAYEERGPLIL